MKQILFLIVMGAMVAGLTACLPQTSTSNGSDACGASAFQGLVGQTEDALEAVDLPGDYRVIHPGDMVTADLRFERLNVLFDAQGTIEAVVCG